MILPLIPSLLPPTSPSPRGHFPRQTDAPSRPSLLLPAPKPPSARLWPTHFLPAPPQIEPLAGSASAPDPPHGSDWLPASLPRCWPSWPEPPPQRLAALCQ